MKRLIFALVLILLIANVSSLGVTPGRNSPEFSPGKTVDGSFTVLNTGMKQLHVAFFVSGDLEEYVEFSEKESFFDSTDRSRTFKYKINFPENLEPGLRVGEIIILEVPDSSAEGTYVGAVGGVATQIYVNVPCPGKCIDGDVNVYEMEGKNTVSVVINNIGEQDISSLESFVDISTLSNVNLASIKFTAVPIESGTRKELISEIPAEISPGVYKVKLVAVFDGESKTLEKRVSIGENTITVEEIIVNEFRLGEVAEIQIAVENNWNEAIENVFAELEVYNSDGQILADVKSSPETIDANKQKDLVMYWDTANLEEGIYDGKLKITFNTYESSNGVKIYVGEFSLGFSPPSESGRRWDFDLTDVLFALIVVLLIINIIWFAFVRKKRR